MLKNTFKLMFASVLVLTTFSSYALKEGINIIEPQVNIKNVKGISSLTNSDLFSGAGVFSVPLDFPKGPKNIQVQMGLNYNSYSTDAFNPYGYAWSMNVPTISRNPKKGIADIYTNNDFVANGEELVSTSDTTNYQAKNSANQNIYTYKNNTWQVQDTKGNTYFYGTSQTAQLSDPIQKDKIYTRYLEKQIDNRGNAINYHYFKDNNQVYLDTIDYAQGLYQIKFTYQNKGRSLTSYRTQFEVKTSKILKNITLIVDNVSTKQYTFVYDDLENVFSHLVKVEETQPHPSPLLQERGQESTKTIYNFTYGTGKDIHLLKEVNINNGLKINYEYKPSVFYKNANGENSNSKLSFNMKTLNTITVTDSTTGVSSRDTYEYADGAYYYDAQDLYGREYAGFGKVSKTTQELTANTDNSHLKKEVYYFHQGQGSAPHPELGENADHISKKGMVYRMEVYDIPLSPTLSPLGRKGEGENEKLLKTEITKWTSEIQGKRWRTYKERETKSMYASGEVSSTAIEYTYDSFNNPVEKKEYGEVKKMAENGDYQDILGDSRTSKYAYIQNPAKNMYGFLKSESTYDSANILTGKKEMAYDNEKESVIYGEPTSIKTYTSENTALEEKREYNGQGQMVKSINPRGYATQYGYDSYGIYPVSVVNAKGQEEQYVYDYRVGKPSKVIDANGLQTVTEYDSYGREIFTSIQAPQSEKYTLKKITYNDTQIPNSIEQTTYFDSTQTNQQTDKILIDGFGNTIETKKTLLGKTSISKVTYDANGSKLFVGFPYFDTDTGSIHYGNKYNYDVLGRVIKVTNTSGNIVYNYDTKGFTITNQNGVQTRYEYDIFGNLIKVIEDYTLTQNNLTPSPSPAGEGKQDKNLVTQYFYNSKGQLTKLIDAEKNERSMVYDLSGRRLQIEDLHKKDDTQYGIKKYIYDANNNMVSISNMDAKEVHYSYDELDRPIEETTQEQTTTYKYDQGTHAIGKLSHIKKQTPSNVYEENYQYDVYGNLSAETKKYDISKYDYQYQNNLAGQRVQTMYPDNTKVNFNYQDGIQTGVIYTDTQGKATNFITHISYNPLQKIDSLEYSNGAIINNSYDPSTNYRIIGKGLKINGVNQQDIAYQYDKVGNIIKLSESNSLVQFNKNVIYNYDVLNRLTEAKYNDQENYNYVYSPTGNIVYNSVLGNYEYEDGGYNNPQAVSKIIPLSPTLSPQGRKGEGEIFFAYDKNGNIIQDKNGSYSYDSKDAQISYTNNSGSIIKYTYNSQGIRVEKQSNSEITRYLNKDYEETVRVVTDGSGNTLSNKTISKYIFLGGKKVASIESKDDKDKIIYHADDQLGGGNIDLDEKGNILQAIDYLPFGGTRTQYNSSEYKNKYLFTGKERDAENGYDYFEARYYDNGNGRFRSVDRMSNNLGITKRGKMLLSNPQELNMYTYVVNNPLIYTDPTGEICEGNADPGVLCIMGNITLGYVQEFFETTIIGADKVYAPENEQEINKPEPQDKFNPLNVTMMVTPLGLRGGVAKYLAKNNITSIFFKDLSRHFRDHGSDFFGVNSAKEYEKKAREYFTSFDSKDVKSWVRESDGALIKIDSKTQTIGILHKDGAIGTFFKQEDTKKFDNYVGNLENSK